MRLFFKPLILALLMAFPAMGQIVAPQIALTGNIGTQGFPLLNNGNLIMATDANRTMSALETSALYIKVTSTVPLTTTRNLITPAGRFQFTIENATTGGQSIQIIGASGTGVTIANGTTVAVWNDGTNYVSIGVGGGGGGGSVMSFAASNLPPLFTVSVASPTVNPALTFILTNAAQNSVLAGPPSAGPGAPSYQTAPTISAANMTSFPTLNQNTTGNAGTASALASTPSLCSTGQAPTGVLANGNATGCASLASGNPSIGAVNAVQTSDGSGAFLDSGCTAVSGVETCPSGLASGGSTQGAAALGVGTGTVPTAGLPTHYHGLIGPATGTADCFLAMPTTQSSGGQVLVFAAGTTINGVCQEVGTWTTPSGGTTSTIASGTSALGTGAISSATCATVVTTTATGTASTDSIIWNPNASIKAVTGYVPSTSGGLTIAGYPTTNAVNWDVCNWTSGSITPGAVTLNWRVVR